jgi:DNA invertase Pin-like site-specific DNA recombinase
MENLENPSPIIPKKKAKLEKKEKEKTFLPVRVYGYLRISTEKQELLANKSSILMLADERGLKNLEWISETKTGKIDWRKRELGKAFELMMEGDTLIMSELSRCSRTFLQQLEFVACCRRKGINLISVCGDIPEVDNENSNIILALQAWKSDVEVKHIARRTKIGLQHAKERGVILGRKPGSMVLDKCLEQNKALVKQWIIEDVKRKEIAKRLEISEVTLRKFIKLHQLCPPKVTGKKEKV